MFSVMDECSAGNERPIYGYSYHFLSRTQVNNMVIDVLAKQDILLKNKKLNLQLIRFLKFIGRE
jgi:hypothetical protein